MTTIFYNGRTGGIGKFLESAIINANGNAIALHSRLGEKEQTRFELERIPNLLAPGGKVGLIQAAAMVPITLCDLDPEGCFKTNVDATLDTITTFCEWAACHSLKPNITFLSTGHVYAYKGSSKLTETDPLQPRSVYARSKVAAENALVDFSKKNDIPLLICRVFGLLAPKQRGEFMLPSMIDRIKNNLWFEIRRLGAVRDYLDGRDVARVLADLTLTARQSSPIEIVNVCSGTPVSIRRIVEALTTILSPNAVEILQEIAGKGLSDKGDGDWIVGDPTKLISYLTVPLQTYALETTLRDACFPPSQEDRLRQLQEIVRPYLGREQSPSRYE